MNGISFKEQERRKLIRSATDEIFLSLSIADTGNYWITPFWNLYCEKGYVQSGGAVKVNYYTISLEQYDKNENCIDCQVDLEDTEGIAEADIEKAVRKIIERNESLWTEK